MIDTSILSSFDQRRDPQYQEYYADAFRSEMQVVWQGTKFDSRAEIEQMCQFRALACSFKRSVLNVRRSRRLLYHYLTEFKVDQETDIINLMYKQLPVQSFVGKYLHNVCTNYKYPPRRQFGEKGAQNDDFKEIYDDARINGRFRYAHALARLMNVVAVRPVIRKDKLAVDILTPDLFRVETDPDDVHTATAIWYPITKGTDLLLIRWTDDVIETYQPGKSRPIDTEDNPYGEIPFCFLRLQEEEDFYGGGDNDLLEARMEANAMRFYANLSNKYESNGILLLTNTDIEDPSKVSIGPGTVLVKNGITNEAESELDPKGEFVSPAGQYTETDQLRRDRLTELLRLKGLPNSSLTDNPGLPLSGAARIAERMELTDIREEDGDALSLMEACFKQKMAIVWNTDMGGNLPVDEVISVVYQKERVILEPKDEYTMDMTLVSDFVTPVTEFVNKYSSVESEMTDDEVVDYVTKNRDLYDKTFGKQPLMALPGPGKVSETLGDPAAGTEGQLKPAEQIDTTAVGEGKAGVVNDPNQKPGAPPAKGGPPVPPPPPPKK